jgi:hypothetical protein
MSDRNWLQPPCEAKEEGVVTMEQACGRKISSSDGLESSVRALKRPSSPMEDRNSPLESASGPKKWSSAPLEQRSHPMKSSGRRAESSNSPTESSSGLMKSSSGPMKQAIAGLRQTFRPPDCPTARPPDRQVGNSTPFSALTSATSTTNQIPAYRKMNACRRRSISGKCTGIPANFPLGTLGKKKVL